MKNITFIKESKTTYDHGYNCAYYEFEITCPVCNYESKREYEDMGLDYQSITCDNCGVFIKLADKRLNDRRKDGKFFKKG